jgi:hypothetical protein
MLTVASAVVCTAVEAQLQKRRVQLLQVQNLHAALVFATLCVASRRL